MYNSKINEGSRFLGVSCCECRACEQICHKNAINLVENEEGFSYPSIDFESCVDCGLCNLVCPMENYSKVLQPIGDVIAAQSRILNVLSSSSSGGIFSLIAEYVLTKSGVVFGAAFDENMILRHIPIEEKGGLQMLRGSKYLHSELGTSYCKVKKYLRDGRYVYFTGTPCQVAGLKTFLKRNYDKLITSDLICHGTPSQKIFSRFVKEMELEKKGKVINYFFRDKRMFGWSTTSTALIRVRSKMNYLRYDYNMKAYFNAFIRGHLMRMDCYSCPFCTSERVSDITLADYWDIHKQHPDFPGDLTKGVSLIILNSNIGCSIWENIKKDTIYIQSSIDKALNTCNTNLRAPTVLPEERESIYSFAFENFKLFRKTYLGQSPEKDKFMYYYRFIKRIIMANVRLLIVNK